jgi:hypothetical protein
VSFHDHMQVMMSSVGWRLGGILSWEIA